MRSGFFGALATCLLVGVVGCEWDSSSDGSTWNDAYSWVNFSGVYRGVNGALIKNFTPGGGGGITPPPPGQGDLVVVNNEDGGTAPAFQTSLEGALVNRPGIVPGSVTIILQKTPEGQSSGSVVDNGSGALVGNYNLVGADPSDEKPITGTINYDTGSWTMTLQSPGLLTACDIRANYTYHSGVTQEPTVPDDPSDPSSNPWDDLYTMRVDQLGNQLTFIDSKNGRYAGVLTGVSNTGGDSSGNTGGQIEALFEVNGTTHDGRPITITGSFSGIYVAPGEGDSNSGTGFLNNRVVQAMWVEQNDGSTAEMLGQTLAISVTLAQDAEAIVDAGTTASDNITEPVEAE